MPGTPASRHALSSPVFDRLELAAVAAAAFRIEEQVVLVQQLADVGLQRDQVRRILGVAADRHRAGDVLVDQPERSAEQVDAGGDDRRPDAGIVEHQRLDEIVDVAAVVRRVDDASLLGRVDRELLRSRRRARSCAGSDRADTRARDRARSAAWSAALRDTSSRACARPSLRQAVAALEKPRDVFPGENGFGDRCQVASASQLIRR